MRVLVLDDPDWETSPDELRLLLDGRRHCINDLYSR